MEIEIKGHRVQIDAEDYNLVKQFSWRICKKEEKQGLLYFHAATRRDVVTNKQQDIRLHRLIMGCVVGDGKVVDHINHDTLDNRKYNLRVCTPAENGYNSRKTGRNTSGYKGVSYIKRDCVYQAGIKHKGISYNIGRADTPEEAAKLYDMAAIKLFGEYALLNFSTSVYTQADMDVVYKRMTDGKYSTNTSGYIGVSLRYKKSKWASSIAYNKQTYFLGMYTDPIDAAKARDRKAIELYGDKAKLNFPIETYKEHNE